MNSIIHQIEFKIIFIALFIQQAGCDVLMPRQPLPPITLEEKLTAFVRDFYLPNHPIVVKRRYISSDGSLNPSDKDSTMNIKCLPISVEKGYVLRDSLVLILRLGDFYSRDSSSFWLYDTRQSPMLHKLFYIWFDCKASKVYSIGSIENRCIVDTDYWILWSGNGCVFRNGVVSCTPQGQNDDGPKVDSCLAILGEQWNREIKYEYKHDMDLFASIFASYPHN